MYYEKKTVDECVWNELHYNRQSNEAAITIFLDEDGVKTFMGIPPLLSIYISFLFMFGSLRSNRYGDFQRICGNKYFRLTLSRVDGWLTCDTTNLDVYIVKFEGLGESRVAQKIDCSAYCKVY